MTRHRQNLTFQAAVELMIEAKVIEGKWSVGTNNTYTEIEIPAGCININKNGFFKRSEVCKLIGWAKLG